MKLNLIAASLGTAVALGGATAAPAAAGSWGTLYAGDRAAGYGTFYNKNGVQAQTEGYQRQLRSGDNGAFISTQYYSYGPGGSYGCGNQDCWRDLGNRQTPRTTSLNWTWAANYMALRADGTQARGAIKVCEDISWAPDPCSATSIQSFGY